METPTVRESFTSHPSSKRVLGTRILPESGPPSRRRLTFDQSLRFRTRPPPSKFGYGCPEGHPIRHVRNARVGAWVPASNLYICICIFISYWRHAHAELRWEATGSMEPRCPFDL